MGEVDLAVDKVLDCSHRWRRLLMQSPEWPHNPGFVGWECSNTGCEVKVTPGDLDPVGLGGVMTNGIRIVGPGGGPLNLQEGGLAKDIVRTADGKARIRHFTHLQ